MPLLEVVDVSGVPVLEKDTPLAANGAWNDGPKDRLNRSRLVDAVRAVAYADQGGTLYIEQCDDAATWVAVATAAVTANQLADTGFVAITKRYYRRRFANGATGQTFLNVYGAVRAGLRAANRATPRVLFNGAIAAGQNSGAIGAAGTTWAPNPSAKAVALTVKATYGAAITAAPTCSVYTSTDGATWDTDAFSTGPSPSFAINSTKQKTVLLDPAIAAVAVAGIQVVNNDGANGLTNVTVTVQEVD